MTKTLVTGAAGFLGSHVVDALVARGDEIVGLDNCRRGRLEQIQRHINEGAIDFRRADIREYALVRDAVEGCDLVLHLAAQSNVMGAGQDLISPSRRTFSARTTWSRRRQKQVSLASCFP